jgi:hypothetical protein
VDGLDVATGHLAYLEPTRRHAAEHTSERANDQGKILTDN